MKKNIRINKTLKLAIIGVIISILMFLGYTVIKLQNGEVYEEEIKIIYEHAWEENIDWTSHLITNPIIPERTLDKSRFIFKDFTDKISVDFKVPVRVSEPVQFEGDALLRGTLRSVYGEQGEMVWEKETLLIKADVSVEGNQILFSAKANEEIMAHKILLTTLTEEYSISGTYIYVFDLIVDGKLVGDSGDYDFKINPKVEYEIMNNITKGVETRSEVLKLKEEETLKILVPVNQTQLNFIYIVAGVLFILMMFVLVFAKSTPNKDVFDRLVDGLLKEYGDRMVALPKSLSLQYGNVMTIENEKDMIKTADEINQPVFYYYSNEAEERKLEMFVFDDVRVYYYNKFGISQ